MHLLIAYISRRTPFYYGWVVLGAAGSSMFVRNAAGSLTFAVFVPLSADETWVEPRRYRRGGGRRRAVGHRSIPAGRLGHRPLRRPRRARAVADHHRPQHHGHGLAGCPHRDLLLRPVRGPHHVQQSAQRRCRHRGWSLVRPAPWPRHRPCCSSPTPAAWWCSRSSPPGSASPTAGRPPGSSSE